MVDIKTPLLKNEHFELQFNKSINMRLNDPRRFGAVLFSKDGSHKLLNSLGIKPLEAAFNDGYLYQKSRNKQQNIKAFIMDRKIVVGVGNIYACESLFMANINPQCKTGDITLQDFSQVDGNLEYFTQNLSVYGCENKTCHLCKGKITRIIQNQTIPHSIVKKCQT